MPSTPLFPRNVLGAPLQPCGMQPLTGFERNGWCTTPPGDSGVHGVCAIVTDEFLRFTLSRGNDLLSPRPDLNFPGLRPGERWCLCAARWQEALEAGVAPPVILEACHESVLAIIPLEDLLAHRADAPQR